ncbi:mucin-associated surface protein (MASP), putative [Trypanosoma cruzi marinkellei]|uniref:Mucin-associated surface protein (MASP), putative n=1 Tax=Trypanosoma cruzi marinkellei TaxID=85056 RepID=K2MQU8_TRYCR|nr:mucin-associated surface protein (MASP), putative [Trypanosoma cruzi marinkellei]
MAMMMTGRVLLVCALCVLWCGAGGGDAWAVNSNGRPDEYYYGANSAYCKNFPTYFHSCNKKDETKTENPTANSVTGGSGGPIEVGEKNVQLGGVDPAGSQGRELKENALGGPGKVGNTPNSPPQAGKGTTAPAALQAAVPPAPPAKPVSPAEPKYSRETNTPDQSANTSTTTEQQSAQQLLQSQPPAGEETTATGDSSPEPETAASSDATGSTPAGGDAEPTSPSPAGQAAASGPGENSAAEGTPDGTLPSVAAVTHDDNTNTTDTATGEGNSTAAGMPAPLFSAPTKSVLDSSVGNDACFHDTRLHAWLLLVLAALAYGTLG